MPSFLRLCCLFAVILLLGHCDSTGPEPEPEPRFGSVIGNVTEAGTTTALGQTVVRVQDKAYETASDGRYQLLEIPVGTHTIRATREGYNDYTEQITIEEGFLTHNIELSSNIPNTRFHGRITNSLDQGLAGVLVSLDNNEAQTDASGLFLFEAVRQAIYILNIAIDGYQSIQEQITLNETDMEYNVQLSADLPGPPSGFQAQVVEDIPGRINTFELSWVSVPGVAAVKGLQLYRSKDGGPYEKINVDLLSTDVVSYRDKDLPSGHYTFQIKSVNIDDQEGMAAQIYDPVGALRMDFVLVQAGSFQMGSNAGAIDEQPVHTVTIGQDYYIGVYEITQEIWEVVKQTNPSYFTGDLQHPVEQVSWHDLQDFIEIVNTWAGGDFFHLPTEAEWEYAARAGTTTSYSFGDSDDALADYAWFDVTSGSRTHTVGSLLPNPWGVHDMHGNVSEWVSDWYDDTYYGSSPSVDHPGPATGLRRVRRGGSWQHSSTYLRSASRGSNMPNYRSNNLGFRLIRTIQ